MTKQFCDKCGKEIKALPGVLHASENGDGKITHSWDLCRRCFVQVKAFFGAGK